MSETAGDKEPFTQDDVEQTILELESNILNTQKVAKSLGFLLNEVNELKSGGGYKGGLQENPANFKKNISQEQNTDDIPTSPQPLLRLSAGEREKWESDLKNGSPKYIHEVIQNNETSVRVKEIAWDVLLGRHCVTASSDSWFYYTGMSGIEVAFSYDGTTLSLPKKGTNEILSISLGHAANVAECLLLIDKAIDIAQNESSLHEPPFKYENYRVFLRIKKTSSARFPSYKTKEKEILKEVVGFYNLVDTAVPSLCDYLNNRWKHLQKSKEEKTA